jgi:hypothetical protein
MRKLETILALAAIIVSSAITTATASPIITAITASGPGLGSFTPTINNTAGTLNLSKTFGSVAPITLIFTVAHSDGPGGPFATTESILNNTGVAFTDFHYDIVGDPGVVFTMFNQSTLTGYTLDSPPVSGPRSLSFTGSQASGATSTAGFNLSPFDPGAGSTYSFQLVQTPTTVVPVPAALPLLGMGLLWLGRYVSRKERA